MLRLATACFVRRARAATAGAPPRALVLALSTTVRGGGGPERPPNDLPLAATVKGPGPENLARTPPQARLTGDEVEEALDPLGRVGRAVEETMKATVGTAAEVMAGKREDPVQHVAEEAINNVPKFQRAREMQAARAKEKLAGSRYPDSEHTIDPAGEAAAREEQQAQQQEGTGAAAQGEGEGQGLVGKVAAAVGKGVEGLKQTVAGAAGGSGGGAAAASVEAVVEQAKRAVGKGVAGVKSGVAHMAEKVGQASAAHEEAMQAAAEEERKARAHGGSEEEGQKGKAEDEAEGSKTKAGAGEDVKAKATGGGRQGPPSENILGADPGPKTEKGEAANGEPWGRGNW